MGERIVRARRYSRQAEQARRARRMSNIKRFVALAVVAYLIGVTLTAVVLWLR